MGAGRGGKEPAPAAEGILMDVKSLGYKTDLIFPAFDGEIVDRGDYLVVRTPSNPYFYWGNFLLFPRPPAEGDYLR